MGRGLKNQKFDHFMPERRLNVDGAQIDWIVLGDLLDSASSFHAEMVKAKESKRSGESEQLAKGKKRARTKWWCFPLGYGVAWVIYTISTLKRAGRSSPKAPRHRDVFFAEWEIRSDLKSKRVECSVCSSHVTCHVER